MLTPNPLTLTRSEMEARRLQAAQDLSHGSSQSTIARRYQVSRMTAFRWARAVRNHEPLELRIAPGRPARLNPEQLNMLKILGEADLWTAAKLQKLIRDLFQISYHQDHCYRMMVKLGLPRKKGRSDAAGI